jgi:spore maturation protein CgeB
MVDRVLFLMEKFCDADPKYGPTNAESMVVGAIATTGLVKETKRFYYDVLCKQFGRERMRQLLIEDCDLFQPELIVYTPMGGLLGIELNPIDGWVPGSAELLQELRQRGIKVYTHLWDTIGREEETRQRHIEFSDLCGDVASNADRFKDPRMIQAWSAVDPTVFYDRGLPRDKDVSFIGSVDYEGKRWAQRISYINALRAAGINVVVRGGQRGDRISWEQYAELLCRSKISLNFSKNLPTPYCQIKGRVFETMACGAMLLEDDGDQTCRFFEPGRDFVIFVSPNDLLGKVQYYLAHEDERLRVARTGYKKVMNKYSAQEMWRGIFEQLGFL